MHQDKMEQNEINGVSWREKSRCTTTLSQHHSKY